MSSLRLRPSDRDYLRPLRQQWQRTLVLSAVVGVATGLGVALFEWVTADVLLAWVFRQTDRVQVVMPIVGLLASALMLYWFGRAASPSTSDEYIRYFHERDIRMPLRSVPARMLASAATLGTGGALGFEGPAIYLGTAIGTATQRISKRLQLEGSMKVLMVAGAAAGVSAVFKTPVTGALFALEVPYEQDVAARAVLPAIVA